MSILEQILEQKRREVATRSAERGFDQVRDEAKASEAPRGFVQSLCATAAPAIIAEIKRASPSKGVIRADLDPLQTAIDYASAGAACVSILTDEQFFSGSDAFVTQVRENSKEAPIPILRKEFIIDTYQVWETRAIGADALLLIAAALPVNELRTLAQEATLAGLDVLFEIHNEEELTIATEVLASVFGSSTDGSRALLGINNRNLKTFEINLETTKILAGQAKSCLPWASVVAESGIYTADDLQTLTSYGADAFLIGESLVASGPPKENLSRLISEYQGAGD